MHIGPGCITALVVVSIGILAVGRIDTRNEVIDTAGMENISIVSAVTILFEIVETISLQDSNTIMVSVERPVVLAWISFFLQRFEKL